MPSACIPPDKDWAMKERIVSLLEPCTLVQRGLEAALHVPIALGILNTRALRVGLCDDMDELEAARPTETPAYKVEAQPIVHSGMLPLFFLFVYRGWLDGIVILQYRAGPPRGFKSWQVVATALG